MQEDSYYSTYLERRFSQTTQKEELFAVSIPRERADDERSSGIGLLRETTRLSTTRAGDGTIVKVNDLLPGHSSIMRELARAGVKSSASFGSTSIEPVRPKVFVVSIGHGADIHIIQEVLRASKNRNLDGVAVARDIMTHGEIYVGAYSYDDGKSTFEPVTTELMAQLLAPDLTWDELDSILARTS